MQHLLWNFLVPRDSGNVIFILVPDAQGLLTLFPSVCSVDKAKCDMVKSPFPTTTPPLPFTLSIS